MLMPMIAFPPLAFLIKDFSILNGPFPDTFPLFSFFPYTIVKLTVKQMLNTNYLQITGFELGSSGIKSNRPVSCASITKAFFVIQVFA